MQVTRSNHWFFTGHSGGHRNSRLRICLATKRICVQSFVKAGHTPAFASGASEIAWGLKIPQEVEQLSPGTAKTEAAYSRAPMPWLNVLCDAMKIPWSTTKTHCSQINKYSLKYTDSASFGYIIRSETVRSYACFICNIWGTSILLPMYYLHFHHPFSRVPVYLYCSDMWHMHVIWKDMERTPTALAARNSSCIISRISLCTTDCYGADGPQSLWIILPCACEVSLFSHVWLFGTLWAVVHQTPLPWISCHALLPTQGSNPHLLLLHHQE